MSNYPKKWLIPQTRQKESTATKLPLLVVKLKRFMSVFCKRRGADGFFLIPHLIKTLTLTFISFGLRRLCLSTGLHFSVAKVQDRFLMKMNDLTFFCIFVIQQNCRSYFIFASSIEKKKTDTDPTSDCVDR